MKNTLWVETTVLPSTDEKMCFLPLEDITFFAGWCRSFATEIKLNVLHLSTCGLFIYKFQVSLQ